MPDIENILADIPEHIDQELFSHLLQNEHINIKRIVSRGHANKKEEWYEQADNEWVILIQGEAILEFAPSGEQKKMRTGDYILIPAYCKHRVEWTDPQQDSIWLAVHFQNT